MRLKELAKHLDVSVSTVSCALRGMPNISDETRQRVVAAANEYGYLPSFAARQLRQNARKKKATGENLEIAFLLRGCIQYDPVYGRMVLGASESLTSSGHHQQLLSLPETHANEMPSAIVAHRFDGLIVSGHLDLDYIRLIAANGLPMVIVGNYDGLEDQFFNVRLDSRGMIEKLLNLCFEKGHRRIAFMSKNRQIAYERHCEEVYESWMKSRGLWDPNLCESMNDTFGVPDVQAEKLLNLHEPPTAVVTLDMDLARMLEDHINHFRKEFVRRVHFACSVMNSEPINRRYDVARVDFSAMGASAALLLPEMIRNPDMPVQQQILSPKLIPSSITVSHTHTQQKDIQ